LLRVFRWVKGVFKDLREDWDRTFYHETQTFIFYHPHTKKLKTRTIVRDRRTGKVLSDDFPQALH
jgi:hypothetical protein